VQRWPFGDEGFTARWHHAVDSGGRLCPNGKRRSGKNRRSLARLAKALPRVFPSAVLSRALSRPSCRQRRGSRSIHNGAAIHFAPIAWRARLLPAAERLAAGAGGSATTARTGCQPHSGHHPRPFGNAHTRGAPASVVCAGNRFIASAGHVDLWTQGPTRMRLSGSSVRTHGASTRPLSICRSNMFPSPPGTACRADSSNLY